MQELFPFLQDIEYKKFNKYLLKINKDTKSAQFLLSDYEITHRDRSSEVIFVKYIFLNL